MKYETRFYLQMTAYATIYGVALWLLIRFYFAPALAEALKNATP